jgi:hypothetical protein
MVVGCIDRGPLGEMRNYSARIRSSSELFVRKYRKLPVDIDRLVQGRDELSASDELSERAR